MQVIKNKLPKGLIELEIEISAEDYGGYFNKALKKITSEIRIDGYRPGKVPQDIIKNKVGDAKIAEEAADQAVRGTYPNALMEEKLITIGGPKIDILKQAFGNPFIYKAIVALLPEVKIGEYKKIKVKKNPIEVKNEDIEKTLNEVRDLRRKEILAERELKKGDKAEVDINVYLDKVPIEGGTAKNQPVVIGQGNFIPGFEDKLLGMKKDEVKEFELRFPKDYFQKTLANKLAEFKVKMNAVYELQLPELNDEFAKMIGNFKDLAGLKEQIRHSLHHEAEDKEAQRKELAILDELIKISEFEELPELLIESETDKILAELKHDFEHQNLKFADYLASIKKTEPELKDSFKPRGEKRVKTALIIRQIAELENIHIHDDELEKEMEKSRAANQENNDILKHLESDEYKSFLRNVMNNRKVLGYLEKMATE